MAIQAIQKIPKGWKKATLKKAAELSKSQWNPGDMDNKYIGLEHINAGELSINGFGNSDNLESNKFIFRTGDILFGKLRPYFRKVWKARFGGICSTDIWVIRNKEGYDQDFLFYFFANPSFINKSMGANKGTHMPRADWDFLSNSFWYFPSLSEQRAIAAILSSLDSKVELLRGQNKTLETTAQAIFKEWFSVNSDKLPKGWRVEKLGKLVNLTIGRTPPRKEPEWFTTNPADIKWLSIKDLGNAGVFVSETSEYLTREGIQEHKIQIVPVNTVLISFKLTVGRVAITLDEMATNEAIAHLRLPKDTELNTEYLYLYFKTFNFGSIGSTSSIATAFNSESLRGLDVLVPDKNVLEKFAEATEPIFKKVANNVIQIRTLSKFRDALLPKLMGGEVRVRGLDA